MGNWNEKPKWEHDCDSCVFLGNTIGGHHTVDLYYHASTEHDYVSVIARYSDDGPDYSSTDLSHARPSGHAELWAAKSLYLELKESNKALGLEKANG